MSGELFVRNSGSNDHLLEIPLGSRLRKANGLVLQLCIRHWSIRCLFRFLSYIEYVLRVAVIFASLSKVGGIKQSNGL